MGAGLCPGVNGWMGLKNTYKLGAPQKYEAQRVQTWLLMWRANDGNTKSGAHLRPLQGSQLPGEMLNSAVVSAAWAPAYKMSSLKPARAQLQHSDAPRIHTRDGIAWQSAVRTMLDRVCGRTPRMTRRPSSACDACLESPSSPASSEGTTESTALPAPPLKRMLKAEPAACATTPKSCYKSTQAWIIRMMHTI